ncbi:hypothetical protein FA13DRAFT_619741 [Coprinellus micaceus]|uniref:Uncharacterized protein n=1 Tax=Coprinellus micaceus TaxID=71717 RepID=A0A4Y7T7U7_COPMI|nr:hypothetical protein FA13DRAFT_619741 [Coprinellus micaceus]
MDRSGVQAFSLAMMNTAHAAGPVHRQPASQSRVSVRRKICKTFAEKQYGIGEDDLRHLDFIQTTSNHMVNHQATKMYLYWERDVEGAAWRRYGGCARFEEYLRRRREGYRRKFPDRPFTLFPKAYKDVLRQEAPPAPAEHPPAQHLPVEQPNLVQAHPGPVSHPVLVQDPPPATNPAGGACDGIAHVPRGTENQRPARRGWEPALQAKASGDPWLFRACDRSIQDALGRGTTERTVLAILPWT